MRLTFFFQGDSFPPLIFPFAQIHFGKSNLRHKIVPTSIVMSIAPSSTQMSVSSEDNVVDNVIISGLPDEKPAFQRDDDETLSPWQGFGLGCCGSCLGVCIAGTCTETKSYSLFGKEGSNTASMIWIGLAFSSYPLFWVSVAMLAISDGASDLGSLFSWSLAGCVLCACALSCGVFFGMVRPRCQANPVAWGVMGFCLPLLSLVFIPLRMCYEGSHWRRSNSLHAYSVGSFFSHLATTAIFIVLAVTNDSDGPPSIFLKVCIATSTLGTFLTAGSASAAVYLRRNGARFSGNNESLEK